MDEAILRSVGAIHARPHRCVIVAAGAGSEAIAWLLRVPGASQTLLEALIPYAEPSLVEFLGGRPAHFVSPETAVAIARRALQRAVCLNTRDFPLLGLGCTGALTTQRPRRGAHRVCVAVGDGKGEAVYSLTLAKGARSRAEEEEVCSRLLLHALALACGVVPGFDLRLSPSEEVEASGELSPVAELLRGRVRSLRVHPDGQAETDSRWAAGVLSGAFNPLHEGHRRLAEVAAQVLGGPVAYELSLENVDKRPLTEEEALRRARQFSGWADLLLTRAPTFREKARLFPGCTFVIGYDTAVRVVAPRYYADEADMHAALAEIERLGCSFLVAGRLHEGAYHTLADVPVPSPFRRLFAEIPSERFRMDISSTELRAQAHGAAHRRPLV